MKSLLSTHEIHYSKLINRLIFCIRDVRTQVYFRRQCEKFPNSIINGEYGALVGLTLSLDNELP